jgi:hypothetical protein
LAAVAVVGLSVIGLLLYPRWAPGPAPSTATTPAPGGFLAGTPSPEPAVPLAPNEPPVEKQIDAMMKAWREAILGRDPDMVMMCDRTFVGDPLTFTPALVKSAQSDSDQRVRAFSTRVLGKFVDPTLIEVFRGLLADPNPHVRENAVWALGELGERAGGLAGVLDKARRGDKAEQVRRAAAAALDKVRGVTPTGRAG